MEEQIISFLKEQFTKIESEFTFDLIQCEVDYLAKIVSVEAKPAELFNTNEFKESELDIILEFKNKFPDFDICFFSNEQVLKFKNPIVIFENHPFIEWTQLYNDLGISLQNGLSFKSSFFYNGSFSMFTGGLNLMQASYLSYPKPHQPLTIETKLVSLEIIDYAIAA